MIDNFMIFVALIFVENTLGNSCYICNFERKDFEKKDKSFNHHIKTEHNLWNYIYYIIYILNKNKIDYNGMESFVMSKYEGNSTEWFPIGKTDYLGKLSPFLFPVNLTFSR